MTYLLGGFSMAPRFWTFWWLARSYSAELQAGWLVVIWHGKENHKDMRLLKEQYTNIYIIIIIYIYKYIHIYIYTYIYIYIFRLSFKRNCQVAVGWCAQDITRLQRCLRTSASTQACTILHVGSNCKPELCPTWSWDLGSMAMSRR